MEINFAWKNKFDQKSELVFLESLSTIIGDSGAKRLVEVARIYELQD